MSGTLLAMPVLRAVDQSGAPMAGAQLQFYLTGTTTPANVYSSSALSTPLSNPVVADSGGLFAPIYLDPTVVYRCQLLSASGALVRDIDPASESVVEATQAQVNAGTASGIYVSPAKLAAWTGVATALGYTPVNKAGDTATNLALAITAPASASAGYLGAPVNEQDASYTLALSDAGKTVRCVNASGVTYTLNAFSSVAFPVGTAIVIRNAGAGAITLTRGAGVILIMAGTNTNKDYTIAGYGLATIVRDAGNDSWVISGVGVS